MKNVLIVVEKSESSLWLAYYAMGLTHRIDARVSILMVVDEEYSDLCGDSGQWIGSPEKRLESVLAEDHSDSAHINYYVTRGRMEEEVPKFIRENAISKMFIGHPEGRRPDAYAKLMKVIDAVNTTTHCEVEVVQKVSAHSKRK
ncbi:universal stress protein [Pseudodesulfovibrio cashew]|uniref:Universal stress protein n=1 Tax=Pseudodesulfovibrio cashew TaxID=2678688 RepID=A0A6I6JE83_9BACT|nr:universal stress protein [Pseudodesulfovibrio cashew]QGY39479.1 universal stress protein [Pseudodesulfovibrio cashew]